MMVDPVGPPSPPRAESPAGGGSPAGFEAVLAAALTGRSAASEPRGGVAETQASNPSGGAPSREHLPESATSSMPAALPIETSEAAAPPPDSELVAPGDALLASGGAPAPSPTGLSLTGMTDVVHHPSSNAPQPHITETGSLTTASTEPYAVQPKPVGLPADIDEIRVSGAGQPDPSSLSTLNVPPTTPSTLGLEARTEALNQEGRPVAELPTGELGGQGAHVLLDSAALGSAAQAPPLAGATRMTPSDEALRQSSDTVAQSYLGSKSVAPSSTFGSANSTTANAFSPALLPSDFGLSWRPGGAKDPAVSLAPALGDDANSLNYALPGPANGSAAPTAAPPGPTVVAAQLLTAPSTPVPAPSVPAFLAQVAQSPGQVRIALAPEGLGTVLVQVSSTPQGLSVVVSASDQAISAIGRQAVIDSLAQAGVPTSRVEFVTTNPSPAQPSGQDPSGSQSDGGHEQANSDRGAERQFEDTRDDSTPSFALPELPNQPDKEEQE